VHLEACEGGQILLIGRGRIPTDAGAGEERFDRDSGQRRGPGPGRFGREADSGGGRAPGEAAEGCGAEQRPMWLRVERVGEEVRGLCSADGEHWLACGSVRIPQGATEQVGLAAIGPRPGSHAWFDTFLLWSAPR
jgi:hypothetical protein